MFLYSWICLASEKRHINFEHIFLFCRPSAPVCPRDVHLQINHDTRK